MLSYFNEGSLNYAKTQELLILLCLRTGNFQKAYLYFWKYDLNEFGKNIDSYFVETMLIFKAYLGILILTNSIQINENSPMMQFRVGRFINSFEHAQKEKTFRNVQIVLIKLIFAVLSYEGDKLFNEIDACKKYTSRHLLKNSLDRSRWMIKAIIYSAERGMTSASIEFVKKNYLNKIGESPILETRQHSHIEIVRYDVLWSLIVKHLRDHITK
jgi:hypothetical protein